MNRSTVEKAIERALGWLDDFTAAPEARMDVVAELSALTDLLSHYPKEEEVKHKPGVYQSLHTDEGSNVTISKWDASGCCGWCSLCKQVHGCQTSCP